MKRTLLLLAATIAIACGSQKAINPGAADANDQSSAAIATQSPRNVGTQVWLVPAEAGDMQKLAQQPELWSVAQQRVDVFSFYQLQVYNQPGFVCGLPCGPNTYQGLMAAVPGGMVRWLSKSFQLAVEVVSVKDYSCDDKVIRESTAPGANSVIESIQAAGGKVTYLSLDEPFTSGLARPGSSVIGGCGLLPDEVAQLQLDFNEVVHAKHPEVQIGLIEAYPNFSPDEIMSFVLALERAGVSLPFFHLDVYLPTVVAHKKDFVADVSRIREFFRAKGIPFGVIITGSDGSSDKQFAAGAWAMARLVAASIGVTEHTVFQSWAESIPGNQHSPKLYPNTVPETNALSHNGQLLGTLEFFRVPPAQ